MNFRSLNYFLDKKALLRSKAFLFVQICPVIKSQSAIIILAAGASTRLGQAKQLLLYKGETLLNRTIRFAMQANCGEVIVVLGARYELIQPTIIEKKITIIYNQNWKKGMSSSLKKGLQMALENNPSTTAILTLLCDQPYISTALIQQFFQTHQTTKAPIVAAQYQDTIGVPALFHKSIFPNLQALTGQQGAKKVIWQFQKEVVGLPFSKGQFDIDTIEQYKNLK